MFAEAIFWRDAVISGRSRRLYRAGFIYVIAFVAGAVALWLGQLRGLAPMFPDPAATFLTAAGRIAMLLGAAWAAGSLAHEKQQLTYWTLILSRLSLREIVFGDMLSSAFQVWVTLMLAAPAAVLAAGYLGGTPSDLAAIAAALTAMLLVGSAVGVLFSALCSQPYAAVLGSCAALVGLTALGICLAPGHALVLRFVCPSAAAAAVLGGRSDAWSGLWCSVAVCVVASLLLGLAAVAVMRRRAADVQFASTRRRRWRLSWIWETLCPRLWRFGLTSPESEQDQPIVWRESAFGAAGAAGQTKALYCLLLAAASIATLSIPRRALPSLTGVVVCVALVWLAVHAAAMGCFAVARAREASALDVLFMLPMQPREILRAQFRGVKNGLILPMLLLAAYAGALTARASLPACPVAALLFLVWTAVGFFAALGVAISARSPSTGKALALGLPLAAGISLGGVLTLWGVLNLMDVTSLDLHEAGALPLWAELLVCLAAAAIWIVIAELAQKALLTDAEFRLQEIIEQS